MRVLPGACGALLLVLGCGTSDENGGTPPATAPASIAISPSNPTVPVGSTLQLAGIVRDSHGTVLAQAPVSWSVLDPTTATVTLSGLVSGVQAGATMVTAQSGPASGSSSLTVANAPTGIHIGLSTYLGGSDVDMARDVTIDSQGNIYVAGNTMSPDFPVTPGAADVTYATGGQQEADAFATKVLPGGTIGWSTFLGGINYERAYAIELDPQGYIILAGRAGAGMPATAGTFQPTFAGGTVSTGAYGPQDGFICKLTPDGSSIVWCSYFGVADYLIIRDVAVDANGDIYVASGTTLGGFPQSWFANAFQPTKNAAGDAIVAKIKGDGSQVIWATYLGGSGDEGTTPSIRVDGQGNVYALYSTTSTDMPLVNAADPTHNGARDFWLAKLSPDGSRLIYATYLGGSGSETTETHGLWVDANGNAIVSGSTDSPNFPTTPGAFQRSPGGGHDMFVAKYSPTGQLLASTYYGGTGSDGTQGVSTDAQGSIYLSGNTDGAAVTTVPLRGPGGGTDVLALKFSGDLSQLLYGARIGGIGADVARSNVVSPSGSWYIVGQTDSDDWPVLNAAQPTHRAMNDAMLFTLIP